jgi:catechol 2,3-dioxygenase-like lactoylglutathione lyase family enzyme
MDFKLELVTVPVSDVDRAKTFYADQVGFVVDHDHTVSDELRFVQLTPPGSACSIAIGTGLVDTAPGSVKGLQLVVDDADAARALLIERGVDADDVQDPGVGSVHRVPRPGRQRVGNPADPQLRVSRGRVRFQCARCAPPRCLRSPDTPVLRRDTREGRLAPC